MRRRPLLLAGAAVCVGLAAVAALLARDVGRQQEALRNGDVRAATTPGSWSVDEALPFSPARSLLGAGDDIAFRNAVAMFRRAHSATLSPARPPGAAALRLETETQLAAQIRRDHDRQRASEASNLLAVLAFFDAAASTRGGDTSADRAILELQHAIHLDPNDQLAKANLELVYQQHSTPYSVRGRERLQRSAHAGASASTPGSGY